MDQIDQLGNYRNTSINVVSIKKSSPHKNKKQKIQWTKDYQISLLIIIKYYSFICTMSVSSKYYYVTGVVFI